jgi:pilus assembly protein CpaB
VKKVKLLAIVSAVITALLLFVYLNSLSITDEPEKTSVVVAASEIPADTVITSDMITQADLPSEAVLADAMTDSTLVVGRFSRETIYPGEQMLKSKLVLAGESQNDTLAYAVEPGMRAITISVNQISGLSYMITPGNHVDIIGYFLQEINTEKTSRVMTVLENITVLAVDDVLKESGKRNDESTQYASITLEVTPKQALNLSMAAAEGQLTVILRSPVDEDLTNLPSITLENILVR